MVLPSLGFSMFKNVFWDVPGDLMVKNPCFDAGGEGLVPSWGAKIPPASQQKPQKNNRSNIVKNSVKTKSGLYKKKSLKSY